MDRNIATTSITTCADLLEQHLKVHLLSVGLTISTVIFLLALVVMKMILLKWTLLILVVVTLGILEMVMAIRVGFDKRLLGQLAKNKFSDEEDLDFLDKSLIQLKLLATNKSGRALEDRLLGCIGLFKKQVLLCCAQLIVLVGGVIVMSL